LQSNFISLLKRREKDGKAKADFASGLGKVGILQDNVRLRPPFDAFVRLKNKIVCTAQTGFPRENEGKMAEKPVSPGFARFGEWRNGELCPYWLRKPETLAKCAPSTFGLKIKIATWPDFATLHSPRRGNRHCRLFVKRVNGLNCRCLCWRWRPK
jgi:hypothetical protein